MRSSTSSKKDSSVPRSEEAKDTQTKDAPIKDAPIKDASTKDAKDGPIKDAKDERSKDTTLKDKRSKDDMKSPAKATQPKPLANLIADLRDGKYKHVVFMAGAGISTAAGIPDFRSPKTGLYANLQKFRLPYPEAVFDIDFLRREPQPFFTLAREMFPTQFEPTDFHRFMRWVADLGVLKRVYTQNIDTLERRAGIPAELIVEAHGSFSGNHCIDCGAAPAEDVEAAILAGRVPRCAACGGIVKPDIVFFGEGLPSRFFELLETDFETDVDLVVVAGTSLQVGPFNQLPDMVSRQCPRWLLNMERVGSLGRRKKDVLVLGSLEDLHLMELTKDSKAEEPKQPKASMEEPKAETKVAEIADLVHKLKLNK